MNPIAANLAGAFALAIGLRICLACRQVRHVRALAGIAAKDAAARSIAQAVVAALETASALGLTVGGGIAWLAWAWPESTVGGAGLIGSAIFPFALLRAAHEMWQRLVIDARHGLNCMTPRRVLRDTLKRLLSAIALAMLMGGLLTWQIETSRTGWMGAGLACAAALVLCEWGRPVLTQLFEPYASLEAGLLKERLTDLAWRCGAPSTPIVVTATSRRSHRANARLAGVAGARRIELSDTLIERLSPEEVVAVVAHEIGHWRHHHVAKDLAMQALVVVLVFVGYAMLATWPSMAAALHLKAPGTAPYLAALAAAISPLWIFFAPFAAAWRRRLEYQADAFAVQHASPAALAQALRELYAINVNVLTSDPVYAGFYATHPEPIERLRRLDGLSKRVV